jgi:uncharacterized protein DUF1501
MLKVLGSPKRLCSGLTRREWLTAGGLFGLGLADFLRLQDAQARSSRPTNDRSFGRAKNVVLLYLFGGPSHLEIADMKPEAAVEVRGSLKPIRSRLPGCDVCECLPNMARVMDRVTVVRSLTHPWNFHGMMWATTGIPEGSIPIEESQRNPLHWPFLGSVFTYLDQKRHGPRPRGAVPDNIILPWLLSSKRAATFYARPHGAFLGSNFDPLFTEFRGKATRSMIRACVGPAAEIWDPHLGITPESRFEIAPEAELPADMTLDRLSGRRSLMEQFEGARKSFDQSVAAQNLDRHRQRAFSLLNSAKVRTALDLSREPDRLRQAYGMTLFGQGALQARRLVEAGCRFVTVIWDEFGQLNSGWDTHVDHHNRLKNDLLPGLDRAFSALVEDLESRGLLDETLILVMNEMGRTPQLQGDGRGHWGRAYSNFFGGAGIARGKVVGKTDRIGASVVERPVSAKDILATIYHLLGIDPHNTFVKDRLNRPLPLVPYGEVVREMLA